MSKDLSDCVKDDSDSVDIVTVKFRTDTNETLTQAFDLKTNVGSLRTHLHQLLNVDPNRIVIKLEGSTLLLDEQNLKELGATSLGTLELQVQGDGIRLPRPAYYLPVVDVITVNVKDKRLIVEIEHRPLDRPWLGGYRDRDNGKVYHHACAQTDFRPKKYSNAEQVDGRSQTCADKGVDHGRRNVRTQTAVDAVDGKRLRARRYQSYQSWLEQDHVLTSVVKIQRAFRRVAAARRSQERADEAQQAAERRKAAAAVARKESTSVMPSTVLESKQQNFCALYTMIGKWWKKERQRIKEIEADHCRKAAQMNLLQKEIKFLLEVEKQRLELKYELTKHDDITFLNKTSKPKMFKNRNGKLLTMDTVGNQKARDLRAVYVDYTAVDQTRASDRTRTLDRLYDVVSGETRYKYRKHLLDAIALERDLTAMQADTASVRSAGARVEQMFRHFVRQPEVNPEAAAEKRPCGDGGGGRVLNAYTCARCKRNLAATDFSLESRANRTNVCATCEWTEQVGAGGHKRADLGPYRRMLRTLRRDEMRRAAYDSECFLMQPAELYRLVSVVWAERSAVSERGQLNALRMVRWRADRPWSPWNCVLLSRSEAEAHARLDGDPARCYDHRFVARVVNRHMTARLQFANLVRAVKSRGGARAKPLSKNWKTVADRFDIKTIP